MGLRSARFDEGERLRRRRYSPWRLLRANAYDFSTLVRDSAWVLLAFAAVLVVGALYFHSASALSFPAALYETLKLLVFQANDPLPTDAFGAALFFAVPLIGILLIVQGVLNFGRRLLDKGSRRESWQVALASTFERHIVICGMGRVGLRIATRLTEVGYGVIVIEREWNGPHVARALALCVPVIIGDAREPATLRQAGIRRARTILAVLSDDLINVEIALTSRKLMPALPVIMRAFNEEIDARLERVLGENAVFSVASLAAPTLAAATLRRGIEHALPLGGAGEETLAVTTITLPTNGPADGGTPATVERFERDHAVRLLRAASPRAPSKADAPLRPGEVVTVIGSPPRIAALHADASAQPTAQPSSADAPPRVIVCGLGKVGYRVIRQLAAQRPQPAIVAIYQPGHGESFESHIRDLPNVTLVEGDARHAETLRAVGVGEADALAALTSDDSVNLQIALAARKECPTIHIVLRVFSDVLAGRLVDLFGIHTTFSTSDLAAPTLAAAAVLPGASHGFFAGSSLYSLDLVSLASGSALTGMTLADVRARLGVLVIELRREGVATVLPPLDTALAPADQIIALATPETLLRLKRL